MYVIPAAGLTVRDPISRKALPPEGREVPESSYWQKRLNAGDVVRGTPPAPEPAPECDCTDDGDACDTHAVPEPLDF